MTAHLVPWAQLAPVREHQKIVRSGDADIAYCVQGRGPAVLFIHGTGIAGHAWRPQVNDLCRRFTTVTFDHQGVGRSSLTAGPLTIDRMAADALAVMDAEGIDRFHVVGHSMGGLIALQVALAATDRVKSLALLCTFADGASVRRLSPTAAWRALRARIGTRAMRRAGMLRLVMAHPYLESVDLERLADDLGQLLGHDLADQPPIAMRHLAAMTRCDLTSRLPDLTGVPTLVASAAHDCIAPPRLGLALANGLAARFVVFPHAGHALPIQCARGLNVTLRQHLAGAEAAHALGVVRGTSPQRARAATMLDAAEAPPSYGAAPRG